MVNESKIKWPLWLLILDVAGTILLGVGLYGQFGGENSLFSDTLDLKFLSIPLIILGAALMLPLVIYTLNRIRSAR